MADDHASDDETSSDSVVKATPSNEKTPSVNTGASTPNDTPTTTSTPAAQPDAGTSTPTSTTTPTTSVSKTLHVQGREILDTCGQPWVARGVEQLTGTPFSADGTFTGLASELIKTGSNAVRILPTIDAFTASDLEAMLSAFEKAQVVTYISPGDRSWFKRSEIKSVLMKHEKGIILDAFQEPDYNDVTRWLKETKAAIADLRGAGYSAPLTVLANLYGRDLPTLLAHGQEVAETDPLHNTILGWQAYWGKSGIYQKQYGMSLTEGVEEAAAAEFPVQVGIDLNADQNDQMDYPAVMAAAQKSGVSWLWWNFWNKFDTWNNNASNDGTAANLTDSGKAFIQNDPNSIKNTAKKACFR